MDYPGKVITKNQVTPTQTSASGNWTLDDAAAAIKNNNWPVAGVPNPISKSLRFNSADSAYLNRTPASAGNRRTWTWSGWVKRSALSSTNWLMTQAAGSGLVNDGFFLSSGMSFYWNFQGAGGSVDTSAVFRDASAWYHIVVKFDTTQATSTNRIIFYVNGVQQTQTGSYPAQNYDGYINSAAATDIGRLTGGTYFSGYLTEINFIDGQALTPSSFGMTDPQTGAWIPKKYTGTYGTNGFYLNFKDATSTTTLGYDYSGNGNNWTANNFSVSPGVGNDSLTDVPTPWLPYNTAGDIGGVVRGNYCTANAVDLGSVAAPTNGNLAQTLSGTNGTGASGTFTVTTGKWYWEVTSNATTNAAQYVGVIRGALPSTAGPTTNPSGFYYGASGNNREDGTTVTYGNSWTNLGVDYVIGVALDCDANTAVFYVNGVSQGTRTLPSTTTGWKPQLGFNSSSGSAAMNYNFGQRPFAYTPPAGFLSLCSTNLPTPTIGFGLTNQGDDYFNAVLWTGNGTTTGNTQAITGVGFTPDLVYIKGRNAAETPIMFDVIRGVNKSLYTSNTLAEESLTNTFQSFDSDGFTVSYNSAYATVFTNKNSTTYVGWSWKANGAGGSNTAGSITSTVSANTTAGFSIATFTQLSGSPYVGTVGHGLGVAPSMVIIKDRSMANGWLVYHASLGATQYLVLNSTAAAATGSNAFNNTAPTSTVFTTAAGSTYWGNAGATAVAYCFAAVAGYSAFGSYTGNGSADGPFVYLGFRPRFVLIKATSGSNNWIIYDTTRNPYNLTNLSLVPDSSAAENGVSSTTENTLDILSNGLKFKTSNALTNGSSVPYIYAAFAESPFKFANAR